MILNPPGLVAGSTQRLPHWRYLQGVGEALIGRGIPPGTVRADRTYTRHGNTMYIVLVWDISHTAGAGGLRFNWEEETGWACSLLGVGPSLATPTQPLTALDGENGSGRDSVNDLGAVAGCRRIGLTSRPRWRSGTSSARPSVRCFTRHGVRGRQLDASRSPPRQHGRAADYR